MWILHIFVIWSCIRIYGVVFHEKNWFKDKAKMRPIQVVVPITNDFITLPRRYAREIKNVS